LAWGHLLFGVFQRLKLGEVVHITVQLVHEVIQLGCSELGLTKNGVLLDQVNLT